ncbi:MAG: LysR family transcriptional regulator [Brucellaceae bacterium]|nr:LysR family transcriptional regulator [Brucellaceae bacterium]
MPYLDSIRVFVRTVELGSITAAGRDQRLSPAVASNRIKELENRLGLRLFNRTTRKLVPTEIGRLYYEHAVKVVDALDQAEAVAAGHSKSPRGVIRVTAPLGIGRRIIAPHVPAFHDRYPDVSVHLRLSDRKVDLFDEGVDVAFVLGDLQDSNMKIRKIADCRRVLCAAPSYLDGRGTPASPDELGSKAHSCLLLRFPGSQEYYWTLETEFGPQKFNVGGPYDSDEGDVLTTWALDGRGIVNKPLFEVNHHIQGGRLVPVLAANPPPTSRFACMYPHRRLQDPKVRLFIDFMIGRCRQQVADLDAQHPAPPGT